jgi:cell division inhibitor SepF
MAGAMRKMAVYLGIVEGDDRYDDYDDAYDDVDDREQARERDASRNGRGRDDGAEGARPGHEDRRGVAPVHAGARDSREPRDSRDSRDPRDSREPRASVATMPARRPSSTPTVAPVSELNRITTIHPRTYNEAKTIGECFRDSTPVIMNLTDMEDADAKRLVDFSAGLVFGLHGTLERVTNKVFLLSPVNVTVTAEDKARMAEGSFFNQS